MGRVRGRLGDRRRSCIELLSFGYWPSRDLAPEEFLGLSLHRMGVAELTVRLALAGSVMAKPLVL
jgi:hypothetical protein